MRASIVVLIVLLATNNLRSTTVLSSASSVGDDGVRMGTTILAAKCVDGVVVAADTRTSVSGYVSNRFARKITPISDSIVLCRSGSAADTQHLADLAKWELSNRDCRMGNSRHCSHSNFPTVVGTSNIAANTMTVSQAARLLRCLMMEANLDSASLICCGYDNTTHDSRILNKGGLRKCTGKGIIHTISPNGALMEELEYAVGGSGSSYILGFLDQALAEQPFSSRTSKEMVEFAGRAVQLAMDRDGSSGGFVRIHVVDKDGIHDHTSTTIIDQSSTSVVDGNTSPNVKNGVVLPGFALPSFQ